jgi:putative peptidoglycan lipid II flippase
VSDASARALIGPSTAMAAGTVASRITGVLRDVAAAAALGFYVVADTYSLGNSLPNIIYILILGGALNAVFIPQLVRKMKEDADDGKAYADRLITLVATALLILSVVAVIAAPLIVRLYTPADYPQEDIDLTVAFARLLLPQIFFYGIYTLFSQVLNTRGKFAAPMFAPIANNVVAIATFLLFIAIAGTGAASDGVLTSGQVWILGLGTTLGVVLQALILIPVLMRVNYRWRPRFDWRGAGLGKAGRLATWTVGLVLVNQLTYLVIVRLAAQANINALDAGAIPAGLTTYQKAHLIFMLPHSIITVSIVTAMLPALSRIAYTGNLHKVGADVGSTMRLVTALITPIAAILAVTGIGVSILLFGYGAATEEQAAALGLIVSIFMLGLLPFTLFYVLLRGYYALEDTRTPFFITIIFSLALLAMAIPLFNLAGAGTPQIAAIAASYSAAYWLGLAIAWIVLARKLGGVDSKRTIWTMVRILIATLIGTAGMLVAVRIVPPLDGDRWLILLTVIAVGAIGMVGYLLAAYLLRIHEVTAAFTLVGSKLRKGRQA